MIRVKVDDELLDIPTESIFTAFKMAHAVRPDAMVVTSTGGGPHELPADADTLLYTGDKVAHWNHPGLTGEIVETMAPRTDARHHWIQWPGQEPGEECTAYYADSLIRVTKLED